MRDELEAGRLAGGWVQTVGTIGNFERMGEPVAYPIRGAHGGGHTAALRSLKRSPRMERPRR